MQRHRPGEPLTLPDLPPVPPLDPAFAERVWLEARAALAAGEPPRRPGRLPQALVASSVVLYLAWAAQFLVSLWQ